MNNKPDHPKSPDSVPKQDPVNTEPIQQQNQQIPQENVPMLEPELPVAQFNQTFTRFNANPVKNKRHHPDWFDRFEQDRIKDNSNQVKYEKQCCSTCCVDTGSHGCCRSGKLIDTLVGYGVGINLYFRFLGSLGCCFILFTIIAAPQVILSICSYIQSGQSIETDYYKLLMATTIGAIGLNNKVCQIATFQFEIDILSFELKCKSGVIDYENSFQYGIISSGEQTCLFVSSNDLYEPYDRENLQNVKSKCDGKESCEFTMTKSDFNNQATVAETSAYVGVHCKDAVIEIGPWPLEQRYVPFIIASCDALIVLIFVIYLFNLGKAEQDYYLRSELHYPMLEYFSLQISNIPKISKLQRDHPGITSQQIILLIKQHLESYLKEKYPQQTPKIYDIQVSETQRAIEMQRQINRLRNDILKMTESTYKQAQDMGKSDIFLKRSPDKNQVNLSQANYQEAVQEFIKEIPKEQNKKQLKIIQANQSIMKKDEQIKVLQCKVEKLQSNLTMKYVWITCESMHDKLQIQKDFTSLPIDWFQFYCCSCCMSEDSNDKLFEKKYKLQVKDAPNPDNINWDNLEYTSKNRFLRKTISLIITLVFLCLSFAAIGAVNDQKLQFMQKYPAINCNLAVYKNFSISNVLDESKGDSQNKGFIECYCKDKLDDIISQSLDPEYQAVCEDWLQNYSLQQSLPWAAAVCLIMVNLIIQVLFTFLSKFEKHQIVSEEYTSRIIKIFLAQFLNTGLILLISNADFQINKESNFPEAIKFLFGGKFNDIDPEWCQYVGTVLLLTLLVNTFTFPLIMLFELILQWLLKVWDRCCCYSNYSKQETYEKFKEVYLGAIFYVDLRYSQILNAIYICMIYGSALPFLYITSFLTITFLYWIDKVGLLSFYRKPDNFDKSLSQVVRQALWVVVFLHCGFAIYVYGSTNIFYETKIDQSIVVMDKVNDEKNKLYEWWNRAIDATNNLPLLIILAALALTFFILIFCLNPLKSILSSCLNCCNETLKAINILNRNKDGEEESPIKKCFTKFLSQDQLEEDLQFTRYQQLNMNEVYKDKHNRLIEEINNRKGIPYAQFAIEIKIDNLPENNSHMMSQSQINQQKVQQQERPKSAGQQQEQVRPQSSKGIIKQQQYKLVGLSSYNLVYNQKYRKYFQDLWNNVHEQPKQ